MHRGRTLNCLRLCRPGAVNSNQGALGCRDHSGGGGDVRWLRAVRQPQWPVPADVSRPPPRGVEHDPEKWEPVFRKIMLKQRDLSAMRRFRLWLIVLALVTSAAPARAENRLNVVASFSILGDFARNVGGERVSVTTLVCPDGDVHVYTPSPSDAQKVADAKLAIINGLGLEGWLSRLVPPRS